METDKTDLLQMKYVWKIIHNQDATIHQEHIKCYMYNYYNLKLLIATYYSKLNVIK